MRKTLFLMGILAMVGSPVAMANSYISNETVTVSNTRSFFENLSVGTYQGAGTLIVANGGQASTEYSLFIGGRGYWAPGTVPGDWAAGAPHEGTVTIAEGGSLAIGTRSGGAPGAQQIVVGGAAKGTLNIAGTLTTPGVLYVRDGSVNISRTGLLLMTGRNAEGLVVGEYKDGYASASNGQVVIDGGRVEVRDSIVTLGSNVSSNTSSGLAKGTMVIQNGAGVDFGTSLVTIGNGQGAIGTMSIESNARVNSGRVQLGFGTGSYGSLTVSGGGSLSVDGYLVNGIGASNGSVQVAAGSAVYADAISLGSNSTTVVVAGGLLATDTDCSSEIYAGAKIEGTLSFLHEGNMLVLKEGVDAGRSTNLNGQLSNLKNVGVEGGTFYRMQGFDHLKSLALVGGTLYLGTTTTELLSGEIVTPGQSPRLVFVIGRDSVEHGSVVKAGHIDGFGKGQDVSQASIMFDMSSYGLDLIGRKVEFIEDQTNKNYVCFDDTVYVDNTASLAALGDNTFNDGTTRFDYVYTGTGIEFKNRLTTTIPPDGPVVNNDEKIESEIVLGDTVVNHGTVTVTPDMSTGMSGNPVTIASFIATGSNLLEAATATYARVHTTVTNNPDGSKHVVIDREPLDMPADVAVLVRRTIDVNPDGADRGKIGDATMGQQVNYMLVSGDGSLTLNRTDLTADKRLTAYSGSRIALNDSTIVVGGSQTHVDASLAAYVGDSELDGTTLSLNNGSSLTTKKVAQAETSFSIKNSSVNFGTTGNNVIASGEGAPIDITNSTVNGNGALNYVTVNNSVVTPAVLAPGATGSRSLTLNNTKVSDSLFNFDLGNVAIQSGGMNQFTLYLLQGTEQLNNVKVALQLTPGQEEAQRASLTNGTTFQLFQYGEGASFTGTLLSDPSLLPVLAPGLIWDLNNLSGGVLSVVWEPIGDGQRIANTLRSAAMTARNFGQTALAHAADFRHPEGKNLWFSGLGYFDNASSHNGRTGYEFNTGGYAVGIDRTFDRTTIGFAFGQTFGTNTPKNNSMYYTAGKIKQDGKLYGLYGRQIVMSSDKNSVYIDGYAMTGNFDNKSEKVSLRNGQLSTAKWEDQAYSLGLIGTWRHEVAAATYLKPFIGIDYTSIGMDEFSESNGAISSTYTDGSYSALTAVVGVGLERTYVLANNMELSPEVSVSYVGDISRKDGKVSYINDYSTPMTEYSVSPGRSAVQLDAAVNWKINERWGARAGYGYSYRSGANSQVVSGLVSYAF